MIIIFLIMKDFVANYITMRNFKLIKILNKSLLTKIFLKVLNTKMHCRLMFLGKMKNKCDQVAEVSNFLLNNIIA